MFSQQPDLQNREIKYFLIEKQNSCKYIIYRSFFVLRGAGWNGIHQLYR